MKNKNDLKKTPKELLKRADETVSGRPTGN